MDFSSIIKDNNSLFVNSILQNITIDCVIDEIINELSNYIEVLDTKVLFHSLEYIFNCIKKIDSLPEDILKKYIHCADTLIVKFQERYEFKIYIQKLANVFDSGYNPDCLFKESFPFLDRLNRVSATIIISCFLIPGFYEKAWDYFVENIKDKLTADDYLKLSENVLYDLCEYSTSIGANFIVENLPTSNIPTSLYMFSNNVDCIEKSITYKSPSLYEVVCESPSDVLSNKEAIINIFKFFPEFNSKSAATVLTAISSSSCSFRNYFSTLDVSDQRKRVLYLIRETFEYFNVKAMENIVDCLDQSDLPPLDSIGCNFLFEILFSYMEKIDSDFFVSKLWKNVQAQREYLNTISNKKNNVTFKNSIPLELIKEAKIDGTICSCWLCPEFVKRFYELNNMEEARIPYKNVFLLALIRSDCEHTERFISVCTDLFSGLVAANISRDYVNVLYSSNKELTKEIVICYSKTKGAKFHKIIDIFSDHLSELIDSGDMLFSIELAFFSANTQKNSHLKEYLEKLLNENKENSIEFFLTYVKNFVLDRAAQHVDIHVPLNIILNVFDDRFSSLSEHIKKLVNSVHSVCLFKPPLQRRKFIDQLPKIVFGNVTEEAKRRFSNYFRDNNIGSFVIDMHHIRVSAPNLFETMKKYMLEELSLVQEQPPSFAEKFGIMIGTFVRECIFGYGDKELGDIFSCFLNQYKEESNESSIRFANNALNICYNVLENDPIFLFSLLKLPRFQKTNPELNEKVTKLTERFSTQHSALPPVRSLEIPQKISRFKDVQSPPLWISKDIHLSNLNLVISSLVGYHDWLALYLVEYIEDHPYQLKQIVSQIEKNKDFLEIFKQAACFEAHSLIVKNSKIESHDGGFQRRRLMVIGRLLGNLTFARNKPLLASYLNLKHVILYALAQGKLFGVMYFIKEIFIQCTPFFNPPNPYTSSILQVLASIDSLELLKMAIKMQISTILRTKFKVSPTNFILLNPVPCLRKDNFDFIVTPYCLSYHHSKPEVDKILHFDENSTTTLIAKNIEIPEEFDSHEQREDFRNAFIKAIHKFIKSEGTHLSKYASTTVYSLIKKDIINNCCDQELLEYSKHLLTNKFASALTSFTVFQKQTVSIQNNMLQIYKDKKEFICNVISMNHNWIALFLGDVVYQLALIDLDELLKKERIVFSQNSNIQECYEPIFESLASLTLSSAQMNLQENSLKSNTEFQKTIDSYFTNINAFLSKHSSANASDQSNFSNELIKIPKFETPEQFAYFIRVMMKYMQKNSENQEQATNTFVRIINDVSKNVPPEYITGIQPRVRSWLTSFIPKFDVVSEFLKVGMITPYHLNRFFFESLNRYPLNFKLLSFTVDFLTKTLVANDRVFKLDPSDMIDALMFISIVDHGIISDEETRNKINDLMNVLNTMEVPNNVLSTNSRLQLASSFDPTEDINTNDLNSLKEKWHKLRDEMISLGNNIKNPEMIDKKIYDILHDCFEPFKNTGSYDKVFLYVFLNESIENVTRFIYLFMNGKECGEYFKSAMKAIKTAIQKNGKVVGLDTERYYRIVVLLRHVTNDNKYTLEFAKFLHEIRPLLIPSFTYSWILLITEPKMVEYLIKNDDKYMCLLITDYFCALCLISETCEEFDRLYKSLLKFMLILVHDFPDFIYKYSVAFVSILLRNYIQLKNIILSAKPTKEFQPEVEEEVRKVSVQSDIMFLMNDSEKKQIPSLPIIYQSIVLTIHQNVDNPSSEELYKLFKSIIEYKKVPFIVINYFHILIDQLRHENKATNYVLRFLLDLPNKEDLKISRIKEVLFTLVLERAAVTIDLSTSNQSKITQDLSEPPLPWGIKKYLKLLTSPDSKFSILNEQFYRSNSEFVQSVLKRYDFKNINIEL